MRSLVESMALADACPPGCPIARAARTARNDIKRLEDTNPEAAARYRRKLREAITLRDESQIASAGVNAFYAMRTGRTPGS